MQLVKEVLHANKMQIHRLNPNSLLPVINPLSLRFMTKTNIQNVEYKKNAFKLFQSEYSLTQHTQDAKLATKKKLFTSNPVVPSKYAANSCLP